MQGLLSILSLFGNKFNFNNIGSRMLDSIYHIISYDIKITLKSLFLASKHQDIAIIYAMLLLTSLHNITKYLDFNTWHNYTPRYNVM